MPNDVPGGLPEVKRGERPFAPGASPAPESTHAALEETARRLDAIVNNTRMALFMMDARQHCVFMNQAAEKLTGYTFAETQGKPLHDVIHHTHPDGRPYPLDDCPIDRAFPEVNQVEGQEMFIHKDGHFYPIAFTASPIRDSQGKAIGTVIEAQNIEEELARDAALRENEAHLSALVEQTAAGVAETDLEGCFIQVNDRFCAILGRSREELLGLKMQDVTHPDDLPANIPLFKRAVQTGQPFDIEKRYLRGDGSVVWVNNTVSLIRSASGDPSSILAVTVDITERKSAESALREEGHNLEILNKVGSALSGELDLERLVQMVTDAGVDLTGAKFGAFFYNVTDEAGESYTLYTLSGADRSQFEKFGMPRNTKVFAPTFDGEGIVRSDDITKDPRYGGNPPHDGMPKGHLPVRSYLAVPVVGRTGEVIGGLFFGHPEAARFKARHERLMEGIAAQAAIAIDNARLFRAAQREIDQRMKAEQALTALNETLESRVLEEADRRSRAEEALRQSQKMETVGQLSGGIAHDFNNLLQIIQGNLSLLRHAIPQREAKWQRAIGNALLGTERAASLTRRLLAFSRRQPLDPRPVDVRRLLADMEELLRRTLGETVQVETKVEPDLPLVQVDPNQLENSILNLAINSRDAMPEGGTLRIRAVNAHVGEDYLETHPEAEAGKYVRLTVADDGEGMAREVLARAVEPFFTTKEVGRGTGLGLSMVYGFVRQSGGFLDLQSKRGTGTSVDLYLPLAIDGAQEVEEQVVRYGLERGNGETVLLCEDDPDVRRFSAETLRDLGYEVIEAGEAKEALKHLRNRGSVDLLFTDIVLPGGKTGADLARDAREIQPGLKVLFATGYARSALDAKQGETSIDLLQKPFSIEDLAARIAALLR